jgi:hypothetical protein
MGKKKQAMKSTVPTPASTLPNVETETAASIDDKQTKDYLVTQVLVVQQYQPEIYEAIMAQGWEQAYLLVKEVISRSLEKGKSALLEEGYKKGFKEGRKEGNEAAIRELVENFNEEHDDGRCVPTEKHIQALKDHGNGLCVPMRLYQIASKQDCVICISAGTQTTYETANTSTQTTPTPTADTFMQMVPPNDGNPNLSTPPLSAMSSLTIPAQTTSTSTSDETTSHTVPRSRRRSATVETVTDIDEPHLLAKNCRKSTRQLQHPPQPYTSRPKPTPATTCFSDETTSHAVHCRSRRRSATVETVTDNDEHVLLAKNLRKSTRRPYQTPRPPQSPQK